MPNQVIIAWISQDRYLGVLMPYEKVEIDQNACSYVIRMWRENTISEQETREWRGWIEHVQSGKRVFFRDTAVISSFINEYLNSASLSE